MRLSSWLDEESLVPHPLEVDEACPPQPLDELPSARDAAAMLSAVSAIEVDDEAPAEAEVDVAASAVRLFLVGGPGAAAAPQSEPLEPFASTDKLSSMAARRMSREQRMYPAT